MNETVIEKIEDKLSDLEGYLYNIEKLLGRLVNIVAVGLIVIIIALFS